MDAATRAVQGRKAGIMSDLIDRQAIFKKVEKIRQGLQMMDDTRRASLIMNGMYLCEKEVRNLPSAQPEIIRCKDCKHRYVDGVNVRFNVCELNHNRVQADDWYCADAERREE